MSKARAAVCLSAGQGCRDSVAHHSIRVYVHLLCAVGSTKQHLQHRVDAFDISPNGTASEHRRSWSRRWDDGVASGQCTQLAQAQANCLEVRPGSRCSRRLGSGDPVCRCAVSHHSKQAVRRWAFECPVLAPAKRMFQRAHYFTPRLQEPVGIQGSRVLTSGAHQKNVPTAAMVERKSWCRILAKPTSAILAV